MESELLRLVYDYSVNRKLIDNEYIEKIIDIVIRYKKIDKYVKVLEILTSKDFVIDVDMETIAVYNSFSQKITVFSDMIDRVLNIQNGYERLFNSVEQLFCKNLVIAQLILHELEHADQNRIIDDEKTIEAKILAFSMGYSNSTILKKLVACGFSNEQLECYKTFKYKIYIENYFLAPEERLAQAKSNQEIIKILLLIKKYVPNLIEFYKLKELESMMLGFRIEHGNVVCPTITYFQEAGVPFGSIRSFDWYIEDLQQSLVLANTKYSFEDRLMYGLPINYEEFSKCNNLLLKAKKYNF